MSNAVHYRVSIPRPHSHLLEVEARFPAGGDVVDAVLPVWTPGSYLVREYARHLQEVTASDDRGQPLALSRADKRTFRCKSNGRAVTFRYKVYANELTVRTSHVDGSHAYFNGATCFLYQESQRGLPHKVSVDAPSGWKTFVALERDGEGFVAPNYDDLIDSPFEVGPHTPVKFTAAGVPHELIVWNADAAVDAQKMANDLKTIVETESAMFGGLPMKQYLFLVYLTDKGRGGLEHKASTALLFPRVNLANSKGYEDFLTLAAHEYFHLWNVKRIKPRVLVPFDYSQESYTTLLWAFEGTTSYYDNLLTRRSGLMPAARYLTRFGETLTTLHSTPGRKIMPLGEASLTSWIKHYRPDENSTNSAISYYLKGEVAALLLDLEIRRATSDKKSLDDVMRLLWQKYGDESGVPEDGVETAAAEIAGRDLGAFFNRAIRTTDELDYSPFAHVGLEVRFRVKESANDKGGSPPREKVMKPKGWLGLTTRGSATIASVLDGAPAMEAGLYPEDDLVALDGYKVDGSALVSRCEDKKPGETCRITLFRRDRLMELEVRLGTKPADAVYVARIENPTDAQKNAFKSWIGAGWDELDR